MERGGTLKPASSQGRCGQLGAEVPDVGGHVRGEWWSVAGAGCWVRARALGDGGRAVQRSR